MSKIFVDVETTGLPARETDYQMPDYEDIKKYDNARIIEIAWLIVDSDDKIISEKSYLISNPSIDSEKNLKAFQVHGISNAMKNKSKNKIRIILGEFMEDLETCDTFVAHNVEFDLNIILSELYRKSMNLDMLKNVKTFDTMKENSYYRSSGRFISLVNLYKKLHNKMFDQKHRALSDIKATYECYVSLRKMPVLDDIKSQIQRLPKSDLQKLSHFILDLSFGKVVSDAPNNHGKPWTGEHVNLIWKYFKEGKKLQEVSELMGRTPGSIKSKVEHKVMEMMAQKKSTQKIVDIVGLSAKKLNKMCYRVELDDPEEKSEEST